ncbi:DUF1906 domain-containing protein [Streptomyces sp. NPDC006552]|uniref:DUF1906 domain-containing protein n=1 Tax=Streptomyces sp. NPDC006552 TaxID=3157179 RepID=UPI0033AA656D
MIIGLVVLVLGAGILPTTGAVAAASAVGATGTVGSARSEGEVARPAGATGPGAWGASVRTFHGWGFDSCRAQSLDTMGRWRASPYQAVGVYFGGRGRACQTQRALNQSWMREVDEMGWRVLPVYVGSQSPCVRSKHKKKVRIGRYPWQQGVSEAQDAVRRAQALLIDVQSPLYLDMEAYNYRQRTCADATLSFVRAWSREVRRQGYLPGFYSSADSGVRHMEAARRAGVRDLPSVMWFARWRTKPHLSGEPALAATAWHPQRRIHQYAGNVKERHGGRTLVIDRNLLHAPVARIG